MSTVAYRIRARKLRAGDECFFCAIAGAEGHTQAALAFVYCVGHQDEATHQGPPFCNACLPLIREAAERITKAQGGTVYDMKAPGAGES